MTAKVTGLGHVGIFVDDVQKMIDFYTGVLGMTLTDRGNGDRGGGDERCYEQGAEREQDHDALAEPVGDGAAGEAQDDHERGGRSDDDALVR